MVHRAGAGDAGARGGRRVVGVAAAAHRAARLPACSPVGTKPSVSSRSSRLASGSPANARTLSKPCSACSAGISGCRATSGASAVATTASSSPRPSGSSKPSRPSLATRSRSPRAPSRASQKSSASSEPTRNVIVCTIPAPARPRRAPGYSKKVMSAPGLPVLVGVEEVVDGRVVLVDGLLDHAQAEHAGVEVDVAGRVAGDAGDVVDAFEAHVISLSSPLVVRAAGRKSLDQEYLLYQVI